MPRFLQGGRGIAAIGAKAAIKHACNSNRVLDKKRVFIVPVTNTCLGSWSVCMYVCMQKVQSAELSEQLNYKQIAFRYDVICSISDNWAGRRRRSKAASQRQQKPSARSLASQSFGFLTSNFNFKMAHLGCSNHYMSHPFLHGSFLATASSYFLYTILRHISNSRNHQNTHFFTKLEMPRNASRFITLPQ